MTAMRLTRRGAIGAGLGWAAGLGAPFVAAPELRAQDFMAPETLRIGSVPYISAGPTFIALARGYFDKVNLKVDVKTFIDGGLAIPVLTAGELDITISTCSAGLFNTLAKGAPFRLFTGGSRERPGVGSQCFMVSNALHAQGLTGIAAMAKAKGSTIGISVRGSISQFLYSKALEKGGLKPSDVEWQWGVGSNISPQMLSANRIGITNLPVPMCFSAEKRGLGKILFWGDEAAPDTQIALWAASGEARTRRRSALVRFAMVQRQAAQDFMQAAQDGNPEIVKILAEATQLPADVIEGSRPRWSGYAPDGMPNLQSVMEQAAFWHRAEMIPKVPTPAEIFELDIAEEAKKRLDDKNPFR